MMRIPFKEPRSPRYIYINPQTNKVHLLVPVVGGQEISTDNTCKAKVALKEFFDGGALSELDRYKNALEFDIALLEESNAERVRKEARLAQIETYIEAISALRYSYGDAITAFMARPSNLYGIQLRPRVQDSLSKVVNPVFNIERKNDTVGNPLSSLYIAMHSMFPAIVAPDPRTKLINAVLSALADSPTFADIQRVLGEQSLVLFGLSIDFTKQLNGTPATKTTIDNLMGFADNASPQDYIDSLLGACAPDMWESIPTPPFYNIPISTPIDERTERLSILTQFFLANLNVYCRAKGLSKENFGVILDASPYLSNELVRLISMALGRGEEVEGAICAFCNVNADKFKLSRSLSADDVTAVNQKFTRTYRAVTATKENPHMDDFMILATEATGETAKFVTHQGSICVDFAEIVDSVLANQDYFRQIRQDFTNHPTEVPHKNEWLADEVAVEPETLLTRLNEHQFAMLPETVKESCRAHPKFLVRQFLHDVSRGKQNEAKALLTATPAHTQTLLRTPGVFTDYSGRIFNCTAYEYAYWAKDTHMCRMLERQMDEKTKRQILACIDEIEHIDEATGRAGGLIYQQWGKTYCSAHFDFTPLREAIRQYIENYSDWYYSNNRFAINAAWKDIGKEQRNVPAHVAQEYCRPDRSFSPTPQFNEEKLPRDLSFYISSLNFGDPWFPLPAPNSGLGYDFVLVRGGLRGATAENTNPACRELQNDWEALFHLDKVRTSDLKELRENLVTSTSLYILRAGDLCGNAKGTA
jgi:SidC N-terminal domain